MSICRSGCEDCLDCRLSCAAPLDRTWRRFPPIDEVSKVAVEQKEDEDENQYVPLRRINQEPGLDESLNAWFDDWMVRRRNWFKMWTKWDENYRRKGSCEHHDYENLVSITKDTLHGEVVGFPIVTALRSYQGHIINLMHLS